MPTTLEAAGWATTQEIRRYLDAESKRRWVHELLVQAWWRAETPLQLKFVRTMYVLYGFADPMIGEGYRAEELNP